MVTAIVLPSQLNGTNNGSASAGNSPSSAGNGRAQPTGNTATREGIDAPNNFERGDINNAEQGTVTITNSTDLSALAQAVASANFGENISINGSNFTGRGGISIDAGELLERTLTINNSILAADIVRARAFNTRGRDALILNNSRIDASRLIRLYASGDSRLRFSGDIQLNSPTTQLSGRTVQVDPGSRVRASGNLSIFTDNANYDRAGFGTIEAQGTKTTAPHANRGRF